MSGTLVGTLSELEMLEIFPNREKKNTLDVELGVHKKAPILLFPTSYNFSSLVHIAQWLRIEIKEASPF